MLAAFPAPAGRRAAPAGKRLTHEDLSQLIIERELGPLIRGLRRAPGAVAGARRASPTARRSTRAGSSFLISKPALADPSMPRWVRWLQPLLSGVFTVDNLDYVRRDAYLTGVAVGPVDVERLRRYAFISERGLTLYEPGLAALEMFLTARRFMYQQVYFHRTVRAIDLDLAEVFGPSIRAIFGDGSPAERLAAYADLDEYALLHQAARWARGEDVAADGAATRATATVTAAPRATAGGRSCCAGRRWRAEAEVRAEYEAGDRPDGADREPRRRPEPGRVAIDLAVVDARPADAARDRRAGWPSRRRDGSPGPSLSAALARLPAYRSSRRRYRRVAG